MSEQTTPSKQNKTPIIILGTAFVIAAVAAVFLYSRTNDLQAKVEQLQSQSSQLQSQLNDANSQITQLQPLAAQARKLPVTARFRKAVTGAGFVLLLQNTSRKPLALSVTLSNPTFNKSKTYRVDIDGGLMKEIGYLEGWAFTSGDQIQIQNAEYDPLSVTIP
jgi:hypothetical protein